MKIYRAIRTDYRTQGFDAHPSMVEFYKKCGMNNHGGMDWAAFTGEPIYWDCNVAGVVDYTETDSAGGLGINVITNNDGVILKHRFWHLQKFYIQAGDKVQPGDLLGWADNTGNSTGSHLHRDVKEMFRDQWGNYQVKYPDNGTYGTIRYDQWFENKFVLEAENIKEGILRKLYIALIKKLLEARKK